MTTEEKKKNIKQRWSKLSGKEITQMLRDYWISTKKITGEPDSFEIAKKIFS